MDTKFTQIACPECGAHIDVNAVLSNKLQKETEDTLREERAKLTLEKNAMAIDKQSHAAKIATQVEEQVAQQRKQWEQTIRESAEQEQVDEIQKLHDQLDAKSNQVKELHQSKAEVQKLIREKEELRSSIELESERKINQTITEATEKIRKTEADKAQFALQERDTVIAQLEGKLGDALQKAKQGSTQLQGEVQELAIEGWLSSQFPYDSISEIKKGEKGADCLQIVRTSKGIDCGTIYYESKRTKNFSPAWIEKFKADIREKNANIGVLVTEAMPQDMERMGLLNGIWVCTFEEFKGLCSVLRQSVLEIGRIRSTQSNKGDKMEMLYGFLTSDQFRLQIEAIVEGFTQMESNIRSERRAMETHWKKQQTQIDKIMGSTTSMYGSIKGIAGAAVGAVPQLELDCNAQ